MKRLLAAGALAALLAAFVPSSAVADDGPESEAKLTGIVESLPSTPGFVGDWVVSGTTVHVTSSTEIDQEDGALAVGATVEVEGTAESDGSITADKVEVKEASDDDQSGRIEFQGIVESLPATPGFVGDWVVSGTTVHVTSSTEIDQNDGALAVGSAVEVKGLAESDGSITADKVEVKEASDVEDGSASLVGILQSIPSTPTLVGRWKVSGHVVRVRETTRIRHRGRLHRGASVRVLGRWMPSGTVRASTIVVRAG